MLDKIAVEGWGSKIPLEVTGSGVSFEGIGLKCCLYKRWRSYVLV